MTHWSRKKSITFWIVSLLTLAGFLLRAASCFWGYPLSLHPDELTIVDNAVDMLRRHSWLTYVYNRPDQFEIKCNALLFALASRILFHAPAYEAFESHFMAFYVIARGYTTLFGTGMIPLAAVLAGRMASEEGLWHRMAEISAAGIFAFSPILVEHSAYATPDVVLTFFVLLFALSAQRYLETGRGKYLWISVLVTGIGITIKYPAAILCFPVAAMVIYRALLDNKPIRILQYGCLSTLLILLTVFLIAPNLFTDFHSAFSTFVNEARPNHLGADGLGWPGNLRYYMKIMIRDLEPFSLAFAASGFVWLLRVRNRRALVLLIGPVYLVCISVLSLHWVQWGIPVYVFYDLLVALGVSAVFCAKLKANLPVTIQKSGTLICILLAGTLGLNLFLSALGQTKNKLVEDTRSVSLRYCMENGISTSNSVFEGYSPLSPNGAAGYRYYAFHLVDGRAYVNEPYATKRYFVTSDSYSGRFLSESEAYPDAAAVYRAIPDSFDLIYRIDGAGSYIRRQYALQNIPSTFHYLQQKIDRTGNTIYIYDLRPKFTILECASSASVDSANQLQFMGDRFRLNGDGQNWLFYQRDNGKVVLLNEWNNLAIGVSERGDDLTLVPAESERSCEFEFIEMNGTVILLSEQGALTWKDGKLVLQPLEAGNEAQKWLLRTPDA